MKISFSTQIVTEFEEEKRGKKKLVTKVVIIPIETVELMDDFHRFFGTYIKLIGFHECKTDDLLKKCEEVKEVISDKKKKKLFIDSMLFFGEDIYNKEKEKMERLLQLVRTCYLADVHLC